MRTTKIVLCLFGASLAACVGSMGGDGDDDGEVPFTNGVSMLAGSADAGYVDGSRKVARFKNPVNVAYRDGLLYVADFDNNKLRVIDVDSHVTSTVVAQQGFARPFGLAFASDGTLYVSTDNDSHGGHTLMSGTIWRINISGRSASVVAEAIGRPRGIAVLPDGRLVAADRLHHVIELIDPRTGAVIVLAGAWDVAGMVEGAGAVARFASPYSVVVRNDGSLLVTDYDNNRIRVVGLDGTTTTLTGTLAGFADGAMSAAQFKHPQGLSIAGNGNVYMTDLDNFRVRRIVGDQVQTVAGDGRAGYLDADDPLTAELFGLEGLSVTPDGSMVFVADGNRGDDGPYNRVRQIKLQ
jgi:DNA-binding beta-propeller fold protein YncE